MARSFETRKAALALCLTRDDILTVLASHKFWRTQQQQPQASSQHESGSLWDANLGLAGALIIYKGTLGVINKLINNTGTGWSLDVSMATSAPPSQSGSTPPLVMDITEIDQTHLQDHPSNDIKRMCDGWLEAVAEGAVPPVTAEQIANIRFFILRLNQAIPHISLLLQAEKSNAMEKDQLSALTFGTVMLLTKAMAVTRTPQEQHYLDTVVGICQRSEYSLPPPPKARSILPIPSLSDVNLSLLPPPPPRRLPSQQQQQPQQDQQQSVIPQQSIIRSHPPLLPTRLIPPALPLQQQQQQQQQQQRQQQQLVGQDMPQAPHPAPALPPLQLTSPPGSQDPTPGLSFFIKPQTNSRGQVARKISPAVPLDPQPATNQPPSPAGTDSKIGTVVESLAPGSISSKVSEAEPQTAVSGGEEPTSNTGGSGGQKQSEMAGSGRGQRMLTPSSDRERDRDLDRGGDRDRDRDRSYSYRSGGSRSHSPSWKDLRHSPGSHGGWERNREGDRGRDRGREREGDRTEGPSSLALSSLPPRPSRERSPGAMNDFSPPWHHRGPPSGRSPSPGHWSRDGSPPRGQPGHTIASIKQHQRQQQMDIARLEANYVRNLSIQLMKAGEKGMSIHEIKKHWPIPNELLSNTSVFSFYKNHPNAFYVALNRIFHFEFTPAGERQHQQHKQQYQQQQQQPQQQGPPPHQPQGEGGQGVKPHKRGGPVAAHAAEYEKDLCRWLEKQGGPRTLWHIKNNMAIPQDIMHWCDGAPNFFKQRTHLFTVTQSGVVVKPNWRMELGLI